MSKKDNNLNKSQFKKLKTDKEYKEMTNIESEIYNGNMRILEKGVRRDQPIALVEKHLAYDTKEYLIAFHYQINDDKLSWGYAFYYDNNKKKAKGDYNKVIKGGNLAHTFDRE